MDNRPIGVFDSGVGGISVLQEALRQLPREHFLFYGDNANAPYGDKDLAEIRRCIRAVVDHLLDRDIKALVIACNTATSASAAQLRQELSIPVIGMEPALKPASLLRHGGQVLVLATDATLHLEKFRLLMQRYGQGAVPIVGRGLVELVESGRADSEEAYRLLEKLFRPYMGAPIDAVVLGCTHYLFLKPALSRLLPDVPLVDGNFGTVRQLGRILEMNDLLSCPNASGGYTLLSSGGESSVQLMQTLLQSP